MLNLKDLCPVFFLTKITFCLLVGFFILSVPSGDCHAEEVTAGEMSSLPQLIASALKGNQQLISAAAQAQRYNIRIPLVDDLSDPFLSFYYLDFPIGNMSSGWTERENQEKAAAPTIINVPSVRGKVLTGRDMVENQALWYDYLSEDLILQVTGQVRVNFYKIYFLDKIISVSEQSLATLDSLIEVSRANYATGKIRQREVLRAHTERYQLQADLIRLRQQRLAAENQINYLSARSNGETLTPLVDPEINHNNLPKFEYSTTDLVSGLYQKRPLIKGYQALGGRFKAMRGMVQMYFNREVQTEAMFEADSGFRAIKAKAADFYNSLVADIQTTAANLEKNRELSKLYGKVIVPQGRQSYEVGLADFRVGAESYSNLLNILLGLYKDQTLYYQALSDYMVDLAKLEEISGTQIN